MRLEKLYKNALKQYVKEKTSLSQQNCGINIHYRRLTDTEEVEEAIRVSLRKLGLSYLDLYLVTNSHYHRYIIL